MIGENKGVNNPYQAWKQKVDTAYRAFANISEKGLDAYPQTDKDPKTLAGEAYQQVNMPVDNAQQAMRDCALEQFSKPQVPQRPEDAATIQAAKDAINQGNWPEVVKLWNKFQGI